MGQLTDDILDGSMCSTCGTCFEREHGHPVLCKQCFDEPENKGLGIPKAYQKELAF